MIYALAAGAVLGQLLDAAWRATAAPAAGVLACIAVAAGCAWVRRKTACFAVGGFAVALGATTLLTAHVERPPDDPKHVASMALPWRGELLGVVRGEPIRRPRTTALLLDAERAGSGANARPVRGLVRLTMRKRRPLHDGERVRLWVTLRAPRSFRSTGAFDLAGYLARRGVYVTGTVWEEPAPTRLGEGSGGLDAMLARWRRDAHHALARGVSGTERAVLAALVLGRGETLPDDVRERFRRAGVLHVLVVSGLHLTLVAAIAVRALELLLLRSEWLALQIDVTRVARLASLVPVLAYLALVGPSVSAVRAVVATALAAVAVGLGRQASPWRAWTTALLLIGAIWPGCVHEAGCQLSFASVAGVLLAKPGVAVGMLARLRGLVWMAAMVTLVTAPVMALQFDALAPMAVVANPVVVPLFGAAVLGPGLLAAALAPWWQAGAAALFAAAGWLVRPGMYAALLLGGRWAVPLPVPRPSWFEIVLCYALMAAWRTLPPGPQRRRACAALLVLLALDAGWWTWQRWAPGSWRIAFLDVGQGDAVVAELPDGRVLVVDAGGFPGSELDPGRAVVEPYLRSRKIARLDVLAMSHAHPDHAGGLPRLIERFRPREFWWAGAGGEGPAWHAVETALAERGVPVRALRRGDVPLEAAGATSIVVLHPPRRWDTTTLNDSSLVLSLHLDDRRLLLTGDVERGAEELLRAGDHLLPLATDVLKVPHHGSRTSSTPHWLAAVRPSLAVVSVGAQNSYGLPAPDVLARYAAAGICLVRTDRCGTVELEESASGWRMRTAVSAPECRCARAGVDATNAPRAARSRRQVVAPSPLRSANMTSPTRSRTPSFWKMLVRCVFTVRSLMRSVSLTSRFL